MVPPKPDYVLSITGEAWRNATLAERALHVAAAQDRIRVRELSPNWGGMVTVYLRVAGWRKPQPWCAAFVYWCLLEAGADRKRLWKGAASTRSLYDWAVATKRLRRTPKRGRLFVWNGQRGGHTGFVTAREAGAGEFLTIEGNTDDAGSREGVRVARRIRATSALMHYPRWGFIDFEGEGLS